MDDTQERYHEYILRRTKEDMREIREDRMDEAKLNVAINHYADTHNMTIDHVRNMINESPASKQLVINYYWEKFTL